MTQCSSSGSSSSTSSSGHPGFKDRNICRSHKLKVVVRIKPLSREKGSKRALHAINNKMVMIEEENDKSKSRSVPRQYLYDVVFGEDSDQVAVYEGTAQVLVQDVLNGYNGTVFAYGATGAGKTYTMVGNPTDPGIMVRALNDIFVTTSQLPNKIDASVTMSYLELYNENIRDLLNPVSGYLELRDESKGRNSNWLIPGLTEVSTTSTDEVMQMLHKGNKSRTVEPTAANETSSRSHALLVVTVKQSCKPPDAEAFHRSRVIQGKLFMVDLAGSEKIRETKCDGKRLQEGAHINRSLLALGNCINALAGGARYVNYRDSKLTRLLKDSLSGNCRTVMIAHVSPAQFNLDESRNTLVYADRANRISTKVEKNILDVGYHVSQYRNIICDLKNEIARLRSKMKSGSVRTKDNANKANADQFQSLRERIVSAFKEQMRLRRKLMELDGNILSLNIAAEQQHAIISDWESRNNKLFKATREGMNSNLNDDYINDAVRKYLCFMNGIKEVEEHVPVEQAWNELEEINRELEKFAESRAVTEKELETCRQRSVALENELPDRITSDEERELLSLMLRVHELEAEKMMLHSERLVKQQELRRRETMIIRYDRQRQISDEIITRQRRIMEDGQLQLPSDLQELYTMYQQEIHSAAYSDQNLLTFASSMDGFGKLPPICSRFSMDCLMKSGTPSSSVESDWESPLPPIQEPSEVERVMGPIVHPLIQPSVLFPPIQLGMKKIQESKKLRRIASDNVINSKTNRSNVRFSNDDKIIANQD